MGGGTSAYWFKLVKILHGDCKTLASAANYQISNIKRPGQDLNQWPQRLKASTLTATPLSLPVETWEKLEN